MLKLEHVTRLYGATTAVDDVSLDVARGQMVAVIGPSGAGKSTLLRMINGLARPTGGRVLFEGSDVSGLQGKALRAWRARCAMIFQQFNLVGRLDVVTNVLMGRLAHRPIVTTLAGWFAEEDRLMAVAALDRLGLGAQLAQRAETLSGGQQQRVAIARALVQEPDIILADEPVASLDPANTRSVMQALRAINRDQGITVLVNLHDVDLAREWCDRVIGLRAGRVVFDDAPTALTGAATTELYGLERLAAE